MCVTFKEELAEDNRKRLTLTANTYVFSIFFSRAFEISEKKIIFRTGRSSTYVFKRSYFQSLISSMIIKVHIETERKIRYIRISRK